MTSTSIRAPDNVNAIVADGRSVQRTILDLHRKFNRSEILGVNTQKIVGALGLAWLLNLFIGFRASRSYRRTLKQGARVRRGRGRFTFHLDLHKTVGLIVIAPLLLIVLTGLVFQFDG